MNSQQVKILEKLANGIIPADEMDEGAGAVNAGMRIADRVDQGINAKVYLAGMEFVEGLGRDVVRMSNQEIHELLGVLREKSPGFFKQFLKDYSYTAAWWVHAEGLRSEENSVTLDPEVKDARGVPVGRITYEWGENDIKLAGAARDKAVEMMRASGAKNVIVGLNYGAHAMGSCRMGSDPRRSVVNEYCQSHDVKNLFICDTSVFVTGSGVNPTLTAMAIAERSAEYIVKEVR